MSIVGRIIVARGRNQTITTAQELVWQDVNGNTVAPTSTKRINLTDILVSTAGTAKAVTIFQSHDGDDALDAGEDIYGPLEFTGQGTIVSNLGFDLPCRKTNAAATNDLFIISSASGTVSWTITAHLTET